jgi:putative endonuclease
MYYVYALHNTLINKIYIGQTSNLNQRLEQHNKKYGNHYTSKFEGEWILIYHESVSTRSEAIKREKQLKSSRGRVYLSQYIPG